MRIDADGTLDIVHLDGNLVSIIFINVTNLTPFTVHFRVGRTGLVLIIFFHIHRELFHIKLKIVFRLDRDGIVFFVVRRFFRMVSVIRIDEDALLP